MGCICNGLIAFTINVLGQHCPYHQVRNICVYKELLVPMWHNQDKHLYIFPLDGLPCILTFMGPYEIL